MRIVLDWIAGALLLALPAQKPGDADVHRLLGLLDYLTGDYGGAVQGGKVVSVEEFEEQKALASDAAAIAKELDAARPGGSFLAPVERVLRVLDAKGSEAELRKETTEARRALLEVFDVRLQPDSPPSLENGRSLYSKSCAVCHAESGDARTPRARDLVPAPVTFLEEKGRTVHSPYHVFHVVTEGVAGTAMPAFDAPALSARDRWDLAFYVASLRHPGKTSAAAPEGLPPLSLGDLSSATDAVLEDRLREMGRPESALAGDLAYLRTVAPFHVPSMEGRLGRARERLAAALAAYRAGDAKGAGRLALDAYLEEIEPTEPTLRAIDRRAATEMETAFLALRRSASEGATAASFARRVEETDRRIAAAQALLGGRREGGAIAFTAAALILLREGIEAALLLAAMLGLLKKLGQERSARFLHAGWIAALAAGALTWWAAGRIVSVSHAGRELVEGIVGLLAAVVLASTSYWILSRAQARRRMETLRRHLEGADGARGRATLFGLAFLAVYREAFETVLFYQALLEERGTAAAAAIGFGALAGAAALVAVVVAIFALGRRLPIGPFFTISGWLLYALAFVFAGKGVHALIEGGFLEPRPIPFPRIEWLGVFPDVLSLGLQALFVVAVCIGVVIEVRSRAVPLPISPREGSRRTPESPSRSGRSRS